MKIISDLSVSGRPHRPRSGLPQPALRLDFITGAYHPGGFGAGLSFTRAGAARYSDAAGVMQTAAADQPRFDFDPATLAPRGLLIEVAATNHLRQTGDVSVAPWVAAVSSTSTRTKIADYRGMAMGRVETLTVNGGLRQTLSGMPGGQQYTVSFFARGPNRVTYVLENGVAAAGVGATVHFDLHLGGLVTVAATTGSPAVTASATALGDGYLCSLTLPTVNAGTVTLNHELRCPGAGAWFELGRPQCEAGTVATSHIATTTAAVTRAADLCSLTLGGWWSAAEGTLLVDWQDIHQTGNSRIIGMAGGRSVMYLTASTGQNNALGLAMWNGTTGISATAAADITKGVQRGVAAWSATGRSVAVRNTLASAATPLWDSGAPSALYLGHDGSGMQPNGCLRQITYYAKRLSDAQVLSLVPV